MPEHETFKSLSFDPGGSTGYSYFNNQMYYDSPTWGGGTFTEPHHHEEIEYLIEVFQPNYVICEDFTFRQSPDSAKQRTGLELISKEYIGILRLLATHHFYKFILQPTSYKNTNLVKDENLDKLNMLRYPKHPNRHYHDAAKHHLHWLIQKKRYQPYIDRLKTRDATA